MDELKIRYYVNPSSIGSYFGVGFNTPQEQFELDSAQKASEFDTDAVERMSLGKHLEDATLNFFEEKLNIKITDRNTEVKWGYGDKIKYIVDGKTHFLGKDMIVENKISNSTSYKFTENMGYIFQCQTYMLVENVDAVLLCGLYQGKPIYTVVERNEEMINDIKEMVDFVVNALMGFVDFNENFPKHLLDKYSSRTMLEPIENMSERTLEYFYKLSDLEAEKKEIEERIKALKALYDDVRIPSAGIYEDDFIKLRVTNVKKKGSFNVDALKLDYPEIDVSKYYNPDVEYSYASVKKK